MLRDPFNKVLKWSVIIILLGILAILYKTYNPIDYIYFPKCPIRELTGLECPGCGSQRAVHHLLNFDIFNAIKENVILVVSIPYILTGLVFDSLKKPNKSILKVRKILFGTIAIYVVLTIIIAFWILRNIL
ncbi:DUF2752 domain-containing protein [Flavobacteriaceae bacterium]|nr:DUF2752 domain-containing protein [Flavobacteriaceae bacterium]MDC1493080.1 DUF2752 domain-containing protein [Flavobacteriaceae bacterium]